MTLITAAASSSPTAIVPASASRAITSTLSRPWAMAATATQQA